MSTFKSGKELDGPQSGDHVEEGKKMSSEECERTKRLQDVLRKWKVEMEKEQVEQKVEYFSHQWIINDFNAMIATTGDVLSPAFEDGRSGHLWRLVYTITEDGFLSLFIALVKKKSVIGEGRDNDLQIKLKLHLSDEVKHIHSYGDQFTDRPRVIKEGRMVGNREFFPIAELKHITLAKGNCVKLHCEVWVMGPKITTVYLD